MFTGGDTGCQFYSGDRCQLGHSWLRAQVQRNEDTHELVPSELGRRGSFVHRGCTSGRLHKADSILAPRRYDLSIAALFPGKTGSN